jgi:hypothetical protein
MSLSSLPPDPPHVLTSPLPPSPLQPPPPITRPPAPPPPQGDFTVPWMSPEPGKGTHRYALLMFEQPSFQQIEPPTKRAYFQTKQVRMALCHSGYDTPAILTTLYDIYSLRPWPPVTFGRLDRPCKHCATVPWHGTSQQ